MSLYEPFGVGNLLVYGSFARVADHVLPNDVATGDSGALLRKLADHPTVPQYLSRPTFERKNLALAKVPYFGFPAPIDAVFLEGGRLLACQATLDGTPHYFLGQRLRHKLRKDDESIVRSHGETCLVVLDTRRTPFDLTAPSMKRDELEEFHEDWRGYEGQTSDFVTARGGLASYMGFLGGAEIVGTTERATTIREYFRPSGQPSKGPLEDGIDWDAMQGEGDLPAATRHLDQGGQVFLTREGYRHLRDRDMVVIRAQRVDPKSAWERLTLVWSPREVEP